MAGSFSTNRSPSLRLDVLEFYASGSWFGEPYGLVTNAAFSAGWAVSLPAPNGDLLSTHRMGISLSNSVARFYLDGVLLSSADVSKWIRSTSNTPQQIIFVKAFTLDYTNLVVGSNYTLQTSSDLTNWTNSGEPFTATNATYTSTNYQRIPNWNNLFFRLK